MDQSRLDKLNAYGLALSAAHVGSSFNVHRPTTADFSSATQIGTIDIAYTSESTLSFKRALTPEKPFVYLLADTVALQSGDVLIGSETLFVSRIDPFRPALGVLCNNRISILSASLVTQAGTNNYGGLSVASSVTIAAGWPASLLVKSKTEADPTRLPSDTKSAYYTALLPNIPGVQIYSGLRLQDDHSNVYQIVSCEKSSFGWLANAALETA